MYSILYEKHKKKIHYLINHNTTTKNGEEGDKYILKSLLPLL